MVVTTSQLDWKLNVTYNNYYQPTWLWYQKGGEGGGVSYKQGERPTKAIWLQKCKGLQLWRPAKVLQV